MRIYLPAESIEKSSGIVLPPDKAHHVVSVMRCRAGDEIGVIDGQGRSYLAKISSIQKRNVLVDIIGELDSDTESSVAIILCQGILKGEKMDMVIQKATELGVREIVPLITGRSQVKETRRISRWRKIAEESSEQCGRSVIPAVSEPASFSDFIGNGRNRRGIIFWEGGGLAVDKAVEKAGREEPLSICIGPEGGFDPSEVEEAESHGFIRASLGRRTLRAETAAIAAVSLVSFIAEKSKETPREV